MEVGSISMATTIIPMQNLKTLHQIQNITAHKDKNHTKATLIAPKMSIKNSSVDPRTMIVGKKNLMILFWLKCKTT
jgi:hypothetical protein